ncbi:MAG: SprT family zinc-dependent metalloprotease [Verrucomicrobiota bacterium]
MQLELLSPAPQRRPERAEFLMVGARAVPLTYHRRPKARRYVLRVKADGSAHVTIPRGGNRQFAREFAQRQSAWIEKQLLKRDAEVAQPWQDGTEFLFRGEKVTLTVQREDPGNTIRFADQTIVLAANAEDLRPFVHKHLAKLAVGELAARTLELAAQHNLAVRRVTVRDQRSRWGSCSRQATISLNWRLIQTPPSVRDYIILHELMHLHEMNHSAKFWRRVEQVCPDYDLAEHWLKQHGDLLR